MILRNRGEDFSVTLWRKIGGVSQNLLKEGWERLDDDVLFSGKKRIQEAQRQEADHKAVAEAWSCIDQGTGSVRHQTQASVVRKKQKQAGRNCQLGLQRQV
ncbi:hypothetical protein ILYODFUR_035950 [Ilyodon furcidens]|uniref:Uncharacterized protein n=1 Tax=Ilyodon furcidens TaxID=33524 RepID=A0ABV0U3C2_9TELE